MKKPRFFPFVNCCFLAFIFLFGTSNYLSAASIVTIRVMEKAEVEKEKIVLGELAEITGEDKGLVRELQSAVMGRAPLPGKFRQMDKEYIKIRLKQQGVDLSQINLQATGEVTIYRGSSEFPAEKIKAAVIDFLYKKMPWDKSSVEIRGIKISHMVVLPKGDITYEVIPPSNTDFLGTIPFSILFKVNGRFQKKIWATVKVGVLTDVVVTKRPLRRYQIITEDDIHLKKKDLAMLPSNIITKCENIIGKRTKRKIDSSVVLKTDLVELPPLVKRGDVVLIIAESECLRITTLGEVKEKGQCGDRIKVVNLDSNKGIYARVMDSNTVKVDF